MQYLILALCLAVGLALLYRWFVDTEPAKIRKTLMWVGGTLLAAGLVVFLVRGGLSVIWWLGLVALPMILRWRGLLRTLHNVAKAARGPSPGQTSSVRTDWVAMTLDHDSGAMQGEVLKGRFAGRRLDEMDQGELMDLLSECEPDDAQSARLVESYIDRTYGSDWRDDGGTRSAGAGRRRGPSTADPGAMTREQALDVLGLQEGASDDEVREAHRRLMMANHPDRGGSSFIAAQINRAKDVLLRRA